jgi:hypothetical protein
LLDPSASDVGFTTARADCSEFASTVLGPQEAETAFSAASFSMANKRRNCYSSPMAVKSCRVTIQDMSGVEHTIEVSASSLYEAVALGLASLRGEDWVAGIAEGLNTVRVSAVNLPIEHSVRIMDFQSWLAKEGGSPRDRSQRYRVREILGITDQRAS